MRIELHSDLDENEIKEKLKSAEIVSEGDYLLIPKNNRFKVYDTEGLIFINLEDIAYVEAFDKIVTVYTEHKHYVSLIKLYEYEDEADYFIRISKSVVVNKHHIQEIRPSLNMKFKLVVNDTLLEVNRTYYYEFKAHIGI